MATEWFMRDGSGVSTHVHEPGTLLIHDRDAQPDWVKLPEESPVDPGKTLKVLGSRYAQCPNCHTNREVVHFLLEEQWAVAQCKPGCGFVFYHMTPKK